MGIFWDLGQDKKIAKHAKRIGDLESRIAALEHELAQVCQVLAETMERLESKFGKDVDQSPDEGQAGRASQRES